MWNLLVLMMHYLKFYGQGLSSMNRVIPLPKIHYFKITEAPSLWEQKEKLLTQKAQNISKLGISSSLIELGNMK